MYWVFEQEIRNPEIAVVMEAPEGYDVIEWMSGKMVQPLSTPVPLSLAPNSGSFRGDVISGIVTLFSDKLRNALESFGVDNVQYFPVELMNSRTNTVEEGYWLVNILGLVDCVVDSTRHLPASQRPTYLEQFSIDPNKAHDFPIFRLYESPSMVVINDQLHDHLVDQGIKGVEMIKTEEYTD